MRFAIRNMMDRAYSGVYRQSSDPTGGSGSQPAPTSAPPAPAPTVTPPVVPPVTEPTKPPTFSEEQQAWLDKKFKEERDKGKSSAERAFEAQREADKKESERQKAIVDGDKDKQLEIERQQRITAEQERDRIKDETVRLKVAAKHSLPEGWHTRLQGDSEADYDKDAKTLATQIAPPKAPNLELGPQGKAATPEDLRKSQEEQQRATGRYSF